MDFFQIDTKEAKGKEGKEGVIEARPDFKVARSKDLMVQGGAFYAVWDEEKGLWSRDEYDVVRLVDDEIRKYVQKAETKGGSCSPKYLRVFSNGGWKQFRTFLKNVSDNSHPLDTKLTFANTVVKKTDYASRRLAYSMAEGDRSAWDELLNTLYSPEERAKIEWAIGAIISGDAKKIEKFLVFYGPGGTGKSTVMKIVQKLFGGLVKEGGYVATFDAKALVGNSNSFATSAFRDNPLVAIQHDGNLSDVVDSSRLNSVVSHEDMTINEKYKATYDNKINAFLFMGTNKPVKITDAKSGIIRRLIDVHPTGQTFEPDHYYALMARIDFELGAIAQHCLDVYRKMGKNYYNAYRPLEMMLQTDIFFNFIEAHYDIFRDQDGATLTQAYSLYKEYCGDTGIEKPLPKYKVREELRNYFKEFKDRTTVDGKIVRSYYSGFTADKFKTTANDDVKAFSLVMDETISLLDLELSEQPAQGWKLDEFENKIPKQSWSKVTTILAEIDTSDLHYVKVPENHIFIDFDLKDDAGNKSLEKNLKAASNWPATYAELSQSEAGVHLHYIFDGDVTQLAQKYSDGIEVKTLLGNASLRRRLTKCNNVPVATISSGLPFKEKKKMLDETVIKSEKGLRDLIARNLRKEIHPGTNPSVAFIKKILDDTYQSGVEFDVTDLRPRIVAFANNSSHKPLPSLKLVQEMKWKSDTTGDKILAPAVRAKDERPVFFDTEVYPNLFILCWKYAGDANVVPMINPSPMDIERFLGFKLTGFNCRRYDNHMLYARMMGYDNEQLYKLSKKIIDGNTAALFGEAYGLSYADIYDFASKKQSLKKWQIELGITHKEMDIPWDEPVPDDRVQDVVDYCCNDVVSEEAVFNARKGDFQARQILAELSGLAVNDTTQKHTAAIIFNGDRNPQRSFVYTHLDKEFPGYKYEFGKSTYRGEVTGEGGYVYAEPGIYKNVVLLDVASMHPTSIEQLNLFGQYTPKFAALKAARIAIKHGDFDSARKMLDGKLAPFLEKEEDAQALSDALKIVINIVYGLTSAKFDNPFRDIRNKDNIVAKRGSLFMIDLKHMVQEAGYQVVHIKTDSIKIPDAPEWLIEQIVQFGQKYGYDFEHEATYKTFCLVNDAVYIAKYGWAKKKEKIGTWEAVGAQFQHPYVFKSLFHPEAELEFNDFCETKQVTKGSMHLDFDAVQKPMFDDGGFDHMHFIGRTGRFVPVREGFGGGLLWRIKDGKAYAVSGTKGYFWAEADVVQNLIKGHAYEMHHVIDMGYFETLADEARKTIEKFGSFEEFVT